jgi:hypothetical protein
VFVCVCVYLKLLVCVCVCVCVCTNQIDIGLAAFRDSRELEGEGGGADRNGIVGIGLSPQLNTPLPDSTGYTNTMIRIPAHTHTILLVGVMLSLERGDRVPAVVGLLSSVGVGPAAKPGVCGLRA